MPSGLLTRISISGRDAQRLEELPAAALRQLRLLEQPLPRDRAAALDGRGHHARIGQGRSAGAAQRVDDAAQLVLALEDDEPRALPRGVQRAVVAAAQDQPAL